MPHVRPITIVSLAVLACLIISVALPAAEPAVPAIPSQPTAGSQTPPPLAKPEQLLVTVGKSFVIDSPVNIERISIANDSLVDAVAINPKEVLVNGKAPGDTSLIIWQEKGTRIMYELTVRPSPAKLEAVRQQIARDFPDADINVTYDNDAAFIRGTVKDVMAADRVKDIASTLGKVVNLLHVQVPAEDPQVCLHVRFADVDRSASLKLGMNLASGSFNTAAALGTGSPVSTNGGSSYSLADSVNVFLYRKDINLLAAIEALQSKSLAQMLAEPNVMAINGVQASFLAGGQFPFPQVQPSSGAASITISFKEYGIRLNFTPNITARGTIRLKVEPEVSSLDYTNAVTISGYTVPGISTRRVQTEVELDSGQSFVIAGLLNNSTTESLSKVPGIGNIPVLGALFKTRSTTKANSELLVIITPELVRPYPADQKAPMLTFKEPFMPTVSEAPLTQPGMDKTGPVPVHPPSPTLPVEQLEADRPKQGQAAPTPTQVLQVVPITTNTPPTAAASGSGKN